MKAVAESSYQAGSHPFYAPLSISRFTWRSSDPAALSIDGNGLATVYLAGERDVTVYAAVGQKEGSSVLHIVNHLLVDPDSSFMFAGQVRSLKFYVDGLPGARTYTGAWSSSNPSVVTVDTTGAVTALSPGSATVSLAIDGTTYRAAISVRGVPAPLRFTQVISGNEAHCALATDGAAWCWGHGTGTSLGTTTQVDRCYAVYFNVGLASAQYDPYRFSCAMEPVRVQVPEPLAALDFSGAACGTAVSGRVYCWGSTPDLPGGTTTSVQPLSSDLTFARFSYPCGVTTTNEAWCYGTSSLRGTAAPSTPSVPSRVDGGSVFGDITGGNPGHRCAITTTGAIMCWGVNPGGQLGTGDTVSSVVPKPIRSTLQFTSVIVRLGESCALSTGNALYCWGSGRTTPTAVSPERQFTSISYASYPGELYSALCGVTALGDVYCAKDANWTMTNIGASRPIRLHAGFCFIGVDGITYCMNGDNARGELGVGDLLPRSVLTRVAGQ